MYSYYSRFAMDYGRTREALRLSEKALHLIRRGFVLSSHTEWENAVMANAQCRIYLGKQWGKASRILDQYLPLSTSPAFPPWMQATLAHCYVMTGREAKGIAMAAQAVDAARGVRKSEYNMRSRDHSTYLTLAGRYREAAEVETQFPLNTTLPDLCGMDLMRRARIARGLGESEKAADFLAQGYTFLADPSVLDAYRARAVEFGTEPIHG
jgi:hypothetical protein